MGYFKKVMHNCKHATLLIEKRSYEHLTPREFFELRFHLLFCSFCRLFKIQSKVINLMVIELFKNSENSALKLDDNFKIELQERIQEELNK